jgi:purine-binding chemotaxis protein CheW
MTDNSRIVIIEAGKSVIGMLVDSVAEVVYIRESEIEQTPNVGSDETSRFIQGVCYKNETLLILVELNRILTGDEWSEIESLSAF